MRIFLSYASETREEAEKLAFSLRNSGHEVFYDQESLPPAESYDDKIRLSIRKSSLFIFLICPNSIEEGRYTLTELQFAQQRWPKSSGHILPVIVRKTDLSKIPHYLKSVSLLEPKGQFVPEVQEQIERIQKSRSRKRIFRIYVPILSIFVSIIFLLYSGLIPGGKYFIRKFIYQDTSRNILESRILEKLKDDNFCTTAREDAILLTRNNPTYATAYRHLGAAHYCLREFGQAVKSFRKAVDLEPQNMNFRYGLAANLALSGNPLEANKIYYHIIDHHRKNSIPYTPALYSVALNLAAVGHFAEAKPEFRKLIWDSVYGERAKFGYELSRIALANPNEVGSIIQTVTELAKGNRDLRQVLVGQVPAGRKGTEFIPYLWALERLGNKQKLLREALVKSHPKK